MNEREIFLAAVEIEDRDKRLQHVQELCGDDTGLRLRVEELLRSHDADDSFLQSPIVDRVEATLISGSESAGTGEPAEQIFRQFLEPTIREGCIGRLAHYEVEEILGRGAFGIVAKGFDTKLHRVVAIKMLAPELATTSPPRKRFLREARSAAAVTHENIVAIHAVEEHPVPYLVMEFVPGGTLADRLDENGPLDTRDIVHIGQQVAAGLAAAHTVNLIHRDIKPSNILLEDGPTKRTKISDFGLARAVDDASMTASGAIAGTPMYMSPEQARGETLDHRTDLFSLGSVLYQMTCGRPPFRAPSTIAVIRRVCDDTPRPLNDVISETPAWLITIIDNLLDKDRDARYQTAAEVAELLARCGSELDLQGHVSCVDVPTSLVTTSEWRGKREEKQSSGSRGLGSQIVAAAALLLCTVAIVGLVYVSLGKLPPKQANDQVDRTEPKIATAPQPDSDAIPRAVDAHRAAALAVLNAGGSVTGYSNKQGFSASTIAELPDGPIAVVSVALNDLPGPFEHVFRQLGQLPWLQRFDAVSSPVTDADLAHLSGLDLESAGLSGTDITDRSAKTIATWQRLRGVDFGGTRVGDDVCRALATIPTLDTVRFNSHFIDRQTISDIGLQALAESKSLRWLSLHGCTEITPLGVARLKSISTLRRLELTDVAAESDDRFVDALSSMKHLQELRLWAHNYSEDSKVVSDQAARSLQQALPNTYVNHPATRSASNERELVDWILEHEPIRLTDVTGATITAVRDVRLPIESLRFDNDSPNGREAGRFEVARGLTSLQWPNLTDADSTLETLARDTRIWWNLRIEESDVTGTGLRALAPLSALVNLSLEECAEIDDDALVSFPNLPKLRTLNLGRCAIQGAGLKYLARAPDVQQLDLDENPIDSESLRHLAALKRLRTLDLSQSTLDDDAVPHLQKLTSLQLLEIWGNPLSAEAIAELHEALPQCLIRWNGGLVVPTRAIRSTAPDHAAIDAQHAAALAVLEVGGTVFGYSDDGRVNVASVADLPSGPFAIESVRLDYVKEPLDRAMETLGRLPVLRSFSATGTELNDAQLANLANLDLTYAGLAGTQIGDASAETIGTWKRLTQIDLSSTQAGDEVCEALSQIQTVRVVQLAGLLDGGGITNVGLRHLAKCPQLTWLFLIRQPGITDDDLRVLNGAQRLKRLHLSSSMITSAGVDALSSLNQLSLLKVSEAGPGEPPVSSGTLKRLQKTLSHLTVIHEDIPVPSEEVARNRWVLQQKPKTIRDIDGGTITDANADASWLSSIRFSADHVLTGKDAANLANAGVLDTIHWPSLKDSDAALEVLGTLPSLNRRIELSESDVSGVGLSHLAQRMSLKALELDYCSNIDDQALAKFPSLPGLLDMKLGTCPIEGPGLKHLARTPNVQHLNLGGTNISSDSLRHLQTLSDLWTLNVTGTAIDDDAVPHLSRLRGLRLLEAWSTNLTQAGIEQLHAAIPECTIRWNEGVVVPEKAESDNSASPQTDAVIEADPHRAAAVAVIEAGGSLHGVWGGGSGRFSASKLSDLPDSPFVVDRVWLEHCNGPLSDVYERLGSVTTLRDLLAHFSTTNDSDLAHLRDLDLSTVGLNSTNITDASAVTIGRWRRLASIDLGYTLAGDSICDALAGLPLLNTVKFNAVEARGAVTDAGIVGLARCPSLTWLALGGCRLVTQAGIRELRDCEHLRLLDVSGTSLDDSAIGALASLQQIRILLLQPPENGKIDIGAQSVKELQDRLPNTWIDHPLTRVHPEEQSIVQFALSLKPDVITAFGRYGELSSETVNPMPVEDLRFLAGQADGSQADGLKGARVLRDLDWRNLTNADEALAVIGKNTSLFETLRIRGADVTGDGLARLAGLSALRSLYLKDCSNLDDAALANLSDLPCLQLLELANCPLAGPGLQALEQVPNLTRLDLARTEVDSNSLQHLAQLPWLRMLNLGGTNIDDEAIPHLAKLKQLQQLEVWSTKLTERGIEELHAALPQCAIRWNGGLIVPDPSAESTKTASVEADPHRSAALAVLDAGGIVSGVTATGTFTASDTASLPSRPIVIEGVDISDFEGAVTDICEHLRRLPRLGTFKAPFTSTTDDDLERLKNLDLLSVGLAGTKITDRSADTIAAWDRLSGLDVSSTATGDGICRVLAGKPCLTYLQFNAGKDFDGVTDAGIANIAECEQLFFLNLVNCRQVTGDGLSKLASLSNLRRLNLSGTRLGDDTIDALSTLDQVSTLKLTQNGVLNSEISDQGAKQLQSKLPSTWVVHPAIALPDDERELTTWALQQNPVQIRFIEGDGTAPATADSSPIGLLRFRDDSPDGSEAERFSQARAITSLSWPNLKNADATLQPLGDLSSLYTNLNLPFSDVSGVGLARLAPLTALDGLALGGSERLDDEALRAFPKLPCLHRLQLDGCAITGPGLRHLSQCPNVVKLNLRHNPILPDGLKHLSSLVWLRTLELEGTQIDDDAVPHLMRLQRLQLLDLRQTDVTATAIERLRAALPRCAIRWDGGLVVPTKTSFDGSHR